MNGVHGLSPYFDGPVHWPVPRGWGGGSTDQGSMVYPLPVLMG